MDTVKINGTEISLPGLTARQTFFTILSGYDKGWNERSSEKEGEGWFRSRYVFTNRKTEQKVLVELYEVL